MQEFTVSQLTAQLPVYYQTSREFCTKGVMRYPKNGALVKYYFYKVYNLTPANVTLIAYTYDVPYDYSTAIYFIFKYLLFDIQNFIGCSSAYFPEMMVETDQSRLEIFVVYAILNYPPIEMSKYLAEFMRSIEFQTIVPSYAKGTVLQFPNGYPLFTDFHTPVEVALMGYTVESLRQWMFYSFIENDTFEEDCSPTSLCALCSDEESVEEHWMAPMWNF